MSVGATTMLNAFKKLWNDDRGNILVIAGAALPLLVGAAGLANDTIEWALWKRQLQRAADSAAVAGVYDRIHSGNTTGTATVVAHDLTLNHHTGIALQATYPQVGYPADTSTKKQQVSVVLAVRKSLSFSAMFMAQAPLIRASATAASIPGSDSYCLVSLEPTTLTGIEGSGNGTIDFTCGMITNSVSTNAALAKGSSIVKATVIAAAGGIAQSNNWQVGKYDPFVPAQADPYASLTPVASDFTGCAASPPALTGSSGAGTTANPGCYSSISVGSNKKLTLNPGTYIISGGGINVQGTLIGTNVSIILSNKNLATNAAIGSFDMNASGTLSLTAPTSGKWAGLAIYQDRRAVDSGGSLASAPNKINGGSTGSVVGALYFPNQGMVYNGGGTSSYICTQFVVKRILFSGNNTTSNKFKDDCPGTGLNKIQGGRKVRLVA